MAKSIKEFKEEAWLRAIQIEKRLKTQYSPLHYTVIFEPSGDFEENLYDNDLEPKDFEDPIPIRVRKMAFCYAKYMMTVADSKGSCEISYIDKETEEQEDQWFAFLDKKSTIKDIYLSILDDTTDAETRKSRFEYYQNNINNLQKEYDLYKVRGYDIGLPPTVVKDIEGNEYRIINMGLTIDW